MVRKRSLREAVTVDETIDFLNELVVLDQKTMSNLLSTRILCSDKFAKHPTVQVQVLESLFDRRSKTYHLGFLGVLNGLFGVDPRTKYGPIQAIVGEERTIIRFQRTNFDEIKVKGKR